jgi:hypothetical protein
MDAAAGAAAAEIGPDDTMPLINPAAEDNNGEGEEDEHRRLQQQHHHHPPPPATRSSFYGTLELYDDDAGMLEDGGFRCCIGVVVEN